MTDLLWWDRAEALLVEALSEWRAGQDAITTATAAVAAMRITMGELPADELEGYPFPGEEEAADSADCICSPDLLERGGFKGGCPVHGLASALRP